MSTLLVRTKRPYIQELDVWRAFAVLLVIFSHLLSMNKLEMSQLSPVISSFGGGMLGVHIFFFISGFVISRSLLDEEQSHSAVSLKGFYQRRVFRIIPPLFSFLLILSLLDGLEIIHHPLSRTLWSAAFMCNFPTVECGWFAGHTWSLAYEEQFYLFFPLIFAFCVKAKRLRVLWAIFIGLLALAFLSKILHWQVHAYGLCFSLLLSGVLCAQHEVEIRKLSARLPSGTSFVMLGALLVPYFLGPIKYLTAFNYLTVHCCIALLIFRSLNQGGLIGALFRNQALRYVGKISYGLYLWQQLFTPPQGVVPWSYIFGIPAFILITVASYHLMEQPLIRYGKRLSKRRIQKLNNRSDELERSIQEQV